MDYPTPITEIKHRISSAHIYVKRDDLLPFSFGGNKVRIAKEFYTDMEQQGKNCMIGYGSSKSNLNRVLANMSYLCRECHIISPLEADGTYKATANSKMVKECGAIIHTCEKNNVAKKVKEVIDECTQKGLQPYYIYGDEYGQGNKITPVRAYAEVYREICEQKEKMKLEFEHIFLATGTGMTQAGLIAGRQLEAGKEQITGISIAREKSIERQVIADYVNAYLGSKGKDIETKEVIVNDNYLCGGYSKYDEKIVNVIKYIFRNEGIPLDTTYTGKAFNGMLDIVSKEKINGNVLFIHTGGTPLFLDNVGMI